MKGLRNKPKHIDNNAIIVDRETIEVLQKAGIDLYGYFETYFDYLEEKFRRNI